MTLGIQRTPDGYRIEISRDVEAPRDVLWGLLADTTRWPDWGPTVEAVECHDRFIGRGTRGRVRISGGITGLWLPFEITSCADYRWTWSVGPPSAGGPFAAFDLAPRIPATGHRVESVTTNAERDGSNRMPDDEHCRVVFELPPLAVGYIPLCERALVKLDLLAARDV